MITEFIQLSLSISMVDAANIQVKDPYLPQEAQAYLLLLLTMLKGGAWIFKADKSYIQAQIYS